MTEGALDQKPEFYRDLTDNPRIARLSNGSEILFTNLPVIKTIRQEVVVDIFGSFYASIAHDLGRRYDTFARCRVKETEPWFTLPVVTGDPFGGPPQTISIFNITEALITLEFESIVPATYEVEIFFISFEL